MTDILKEFIISISNPNIQIYILRLCGLIYGEALGDALGASHEGTTKTRLAQIYPNGVQGFPEVLANNSAKNQDWTDDTDQLILLMETLNENDMQFCELTFASKLKKWKMHGFPELGDIYGKGAGSYFSRVVLHDQFEIEPLIASEEVYNQLGRKPASNGAIMRTAIMGILANWSDPTVCMTFCTHWDDKCVVSCLMITRIIHRILYHQLQIEHLNDAFLMHKIFDKTLLNFCYYDEHKDELQKYRNIIFNENLDRSLELLDLGNEFAVGWGYTLKCLGSAIWALRKLYKLYVTFNKSHADAYKEIILLVINQGGDTDTNAAVCGALIGCFIGYSNLDAKWLDRLKHKNWLDLKIINFITKNIINDLKVVIKD